MDNPRWANDKAAAEHLGVARATIHDYVRRGIVTRHTIAGTARYDLNELDDILRGATPATPNGHTDAGATAADALTRIRAALPDGKPLIQVAAIHDILDHIAAELGINA